MRFSESWLRELANPPVATDALVEQLTMAGLEVDSVEPAAADFSGVVVGEVREIRSHPDADKLRVCKVDAGLDEPLQIVCGASNVRVGMRVPTALVGAELPGNFKIKKSKLRGEISLGMLCSEKELGLAEDADGLMELHSDAPVGRDVREYLALNDSVIEVDLTPNRADCLSVEGIAREVAVLNRLEFRPDQTEAVEIGHQQTLAVHNEAPEACPRYLGRLIKGVDSMVETPLWMQERLRRSGLRSLGPLVDVTNYVLQELGQPLHAFDASKISGDIHIRYGHDGEELALLNGQTIEVATDTLVIADEASALALAGVMGGSESAVGDDTVDVFLECAFFSPETMMGKARQYGLHTDSSHRFERGVDPLLQTRAIERATRLIIEICGGKAGTITEFKAASKLPERKPVFLRKQRIAKILGVDLPASEVGEILQRLGMTIDELEDGWRVTPPGFRFDIAIEADLIEELGRIHGYNKLPQNSLLMRSQLAKAPEAILELDRVKDLLVDRDYQEVITYSFVDGAIQTVIAPDDELIRIRNPISSELSVMRTTLWCGLIQAAQRNQNRQQGRIRIFETGLRFVNGLESLAQEKMLAGLAFGEVNSEQWGETARDVDFFDVKADVESLCALTGNTARFRAGKHPALHPGQTAEIVSAEGERMGWLGMLHPLLEKQFGFPGSVFLFEMKQDLLLERRVPTFKPLSRYPAVRRDLALIVDERVASQSILDEIFQCGETAVQDAVIFDVYRGQGVEKGKKSIALGIILQDFKQTLTDSEIDAIVSKVLNRLTINLDAKLRD
ncbi:MAG: phenylalanine--tRNA ligase subunit beta [Gammaproteobacteria bacterium]